MSIHRNLIWDDKFNQLAIYNAEVSRGIVHTADYAERMKALQAEYDAKRRAYGLNFCIVIL